MGKFVHFYEKDREASEECPPIETHEEFDYIWIIESIGAENFLTKYTLLCTFYSGVRVVEWEDGKYEGMQKGRLDHIHPNMNYECCIHNGKYRGLDVRAVLAVRHKEFNANPL